MVKKSNKNIFVFGIVIIILIAVILAYLLVFNTRTVEQITADDSYVNKKVAVAGLVKSPIKVGQLSGYTLFDKNGDAIAVASENLPAEGNKVIARGILRKGPLGLSYYIETDYRAKIKQLF